MPLLFSRCYKAFAVQGYSREGNDSQHDKHQGLAAEHKVGEGCGLRFANAVDAKAEDYSPLPGAYAAVGRNAHRQACDYECNQYRG